MAEKLCEVCEELPAVVRLTAANADGELLDTIHVCAQPRCLHEAGGLLTVGSPSKSFQVRS